MGSSYRENAYLGDEGRSRTIFGRYAILLHEIAIEIVVILMNDDGERLIDVDRTPEGVIWTLVAHCPRKSSSLRLLCNQTGVNDQQFTRVLQMQWYFEVHLTPICSMKVALDATCWQGFFLFFFLPSCQLST